MIKWVAFAIGSLVWIVICWFFGNMVGGTAAGVPASMAMDDCARRVVAQAAARGEVVDMMDARAHPDCRAIHRQKLEELSAPAIRKGLLWGVVPVVLLGGLMVLRSRS